MVCGMGSTGFLRHRVDWGDMASVAEIRISELAAGGSRELRELVKASESEIEALSGGFRSLAMEADRILSLAGEIVGCVESDEVAAVLPNVRALCDVAREFIHERSAATSRILETSANETKLLERLTRLTRGQRSVARETQTLSVLTNIEVARLGDLGKGFQYLAHELDGFSQAVVKSTKELAAHTEERNRGIAVTQSKMTASMPRIREELGRIEVALDGALRGIDLGQARLYEAPAQFRECVSEIASQIDGVVAAIQGHDITRQQIEHVCEHLEAEVGELDAVADVGAAGRVAGLLRVECYQLRDARATVEGWIEQIRACVRGILAVSSAGLSEIGPIVLEQERELARQLGHIEELEVECQRDHEEIEATISGLSSLMDLVGEHLDRSREVQERLQLLTFNSIVEASRLGSKADAILEISQSIKRISEDWSGLTDQSGRVMEEILALVEDARSGMDAFSGESRQRLSETGAATRKSLEAMGAAARFAAHQAETIGDGIAGLRGHLENLGAVGERLESCFARVGAVLETLERAEAEWLERWPGAFDRCDRATLEAALGGGYSIERERQLLRAALYGEPMPEANMVMAGNEVELF